MPPRDCLARIDKWRWRIRQQGPMRTEGIIYAASRWIDNLGQDGSLTQVANVACLPGIVGPSMAMPDFHQGYGFPIGGVAAFDLDEGVVSPGGVGYDINCGVRLLNTKLQADDVKDRMPALIQAIFNSVPAGVGSSRKDLRLSDKEMDEVLRRGAGWAIEQGYGNPADSERIESAGCIAGANPKKVSQRAKTRGQTQLGTLGSGNHFIELGRVDKVFDPIRATRLGLKEGALTVMIHTGSRGLGHQVCDDALRQMLKASKKYGIDLPDRQLCCAPVQSPESQAYLSAMAAAANFAFANRQIITHHVRQSLAQVLEKPLEKLGMNLVYDVAHNMAKIENHIVDGKRRKLCVHRKGATRAFGPGHPDLPEGLRDLGQPVIIPGDMGRYSYLLSGAAKAMEETFGSACHGAGRLLSRHQAKKKARGRSIEKEMAALGVLVRGASRNTLAEEIPEAYKDVAEVVEVISGAGIATSVLRLKPMGVVKG
ncbi:MAG: RtcB family protein [Deltaproteobacteria bacterium]|nr:RtcB family protein [Deltaproteobacteria bacterium]